MTLDDIACAYWADIARKAGLPADGWTLFPISIRDDANRARAVYRALHDTAGDFTYHYQHKPDDYAHFADHFATQMSASKAFATTPTAGIISPWFLDDTRMASLSHYVDGAPLTVWLSEAEGDPAAQLALLTKAGAWLAKLHSTQTIEHRNFQTRHALGYYNALRDRIERGQQKVAAPDLFLAGIETLNVCAARYDGKPTVSAVQHGDFHLRNLIYDGTCMTGIDVSKTASAPVGYDIARILFDFTSDVYGPQGLKQGQVIAQPVMDAFFAGYHLVGQDDPSVTFLLYARVLATLNLVPQPKADRTAAKQRSLQRLRPIARKAFHIS